ncbi:virulence factor TspB C-terminal domain-related protein [Psychrobacter urativorans]|uniref:virulence factor TspB C-terminal domain-related protein n=1 Tax=Psychrobacter urativorans TaxID=45610 RepID=UPI00191B6670|nr:virulence factor TspB C-terminal domain-related protein [Psychrobacter urativorans]
MRKIIYLFLSIFLIFSSVTSSYAAVSSWKVTNAVSRGARVVVSATNSGYKSAVNVAPNVGRVGKILVKKGNSAFLAYALISAAVDHVMDPANNTVKLKVPAVEGEYYWTYPRANIRAESPEEACAIRFSGTPYKVEYLEFNSSGTQAACVYLSYNGQPRKTDTVDRVTIRAAEDAKEKVVPIDYLPSSIVESAASAVVSDGMAGDAKAKDILKAAAVESVVAGDFDRDLMSGAIPINDPKPVIPAVPIGQDGDVGAGVIGGEVGAAADAARDAAESAARAAGAAVDAAKDAADDARRAADEAKDLISSSVDQAIKDAAIAAAAEAAKSAADAREVADSALGESAKAAKDSAKAAKDAAKAGTKGVADAQGALDVAVITGDAAKIKAAEKALADAQAKSDAATKAADKAKEAADDAAAAKPDAVPFALPAFCTWASVVCEFTEWVKTEPEEPPEGSGMIDIEEPSETMHEGILERMYISMPAECPPDVPLEFMDVKIFFPMHIFCQFASMMKPLILLFAYIKGLSIIGTGLS